VQPALDLREARTTIVVSTAVISTPVMTTPIATAVRGGA
jgi:hypothetical protein